MRDGYRFEFGAFDKPDEPKVQALKPLEEAAEVFGAWQDCDDMRYSPIMTARSAEGFTQEDVDAAIERCNERNRERGRL